ncbi:MAG: tyrosine-type recombinase/integrase [Trueperaceae bacterium]|nr:tyrosine-type recombinase/integrase [Trueperaceae bacterium]
MDRQLGTLALRARDWAGLSDGDLKRRAAAAANARDVAELWGLVEAHLVTKGGAGVRISAHTLRNYRRGLLDLVVAWQGENLLRPTRDAADLYVTHLGERLAPGTVRVKIAAARALYKALRWAGATELRPFEDVVLLRDPTAAWDKRQPYTGEEVSRLLAVAEPTDRVLVLLGAHAGLRVSEIVALAWGDVDLDDAVLRVSRGKGGKAGVVHLSGTTVDALNAIAATRRQRGFVMPFRSTQRAYPRIQRLAVRAGLGRGKGLHALRHYCGTRVATEQGLEAAQQHLRHSNLATTQTYAKWRERIRIKEMVAQW